MNFDQNTFISPEAQLTYILLKTDGGVRMDTLDIKPIHYVNKERATQWYQNLLAILSDKNSDAANALTMIYNIMTLKDKEFNDNEGESA